jgi:hypothetical protein
MANGEYTSGDPGFVNAAKGDFRLKSDAEVFCRIGFRPIPMEEIGLYEDEYRATRLSGARPVGATDRSG